MVKSVLWRGEGIECKKGRKSGKQVVLIETRDRLGNGVRRQWSELLPINLKKNF